MVTEPDCYTFQIDDCDMDPLGPAHKENLDIIRLVYDFSCYLDVNETVGQILLTNITLLTTTQAYRGWQTDYPPSDGTAVALPTDEFPLLVSNQLVTGNGKLVEIWLTAGTPGLAYVLSFVAVGSYTQRRKQVDTVVLVDVPINPAMANSGVIPEDIYVKKAGDQMSGPLQILAGSTALLVPNGAGSFGSVVVTGGGTSLTNLSGGTHLASLQVDGAITAVGNITSTGGIIDAAEIDCNTLRVDVAETAANLNVGGNVTINGGGTALSVPGGNISTGGAIIAHTAQLGSGGQLTIDANGNLDTAGHLDGTAVVCNTLRVDVNAQITGLTIIGGLTADVIHVGPTTIDNAGNYTTTGNITSSGANGLLDANTVACNVLRCDVSATVPNLIVSGSITSSYFNSIGAAHVNGDTTIDGMLTVNGQTGGTSITAPHGNISTLGAIVAASGSISGSLSAGSMTLPAGGSINANGNIFCNGNLTTNSQLTANGAIINGLTTINQTLTCTSSINVSGGALAVNGNISSNSNVIANGNLTTNSGIFANSGTINGQLIVNGGGNSIVTTAGNIQSAGEGFKPGGGVWADSSDRRLKMDIQEYTTGLDAVMQLNPMSYKFNGRGGTLNDGRTHIGLIANDVLEIMPEMIGRRRGKVNVDDEDEDDILTMNATALIYALVNSVKELKAEIADLRLQIRTSPDQ